MKAHVLLGADTRRSAAEGATLALLDMVRGENGADPKHDVIVFGHSSAKLGWSTVRYGFAKIGNFECLRMRTVEGLAFGLLPTEASASLGVTPTEHDIVVMATLRCGAEFKHATIVFGFVVDVSAPSKPRVRSVFDPTPAAAATAVAA